MIRYVTIADLRAFREANDRLGPATELIIEELQGADERMLASSDPQAPYLALGTQEAALKHWEACIAETVPVAVRFLGQEAGRRPGEDGRAWYLRVMVGLAGSLAKTQDCQKRNGIVLLAV